MALGVFIETKNMYSHILSIKLSANQDLITTPIRVKLVLLTVAVRRTKHNMVGNIIN